MNANIRSTVIRVSSSEIGTSCFRAFGAGGLACFVAEVCESSAEGGDIVEAGLLTAPGVVGCGCVLFVDLRVGDLRLCCRS